MPGHQRHMQSYIILKEDYAFLTNSRCFSLSAAFSWSNWEQYLLEWKIWLSRGSHNRGLHSNLTIYTTSSSLDEDWPLVCFMVVHFICSMNSSIPHYCTVSTFHCPSQFVWKNGTFSLHFSRESHAKIRFQRFFWLTLCGTQASEWLT